METDFIYFRPRTERDPDGSKLRELLHAYVACAEIQELRAYLLPFVIVAAVPVWIVACRPASLPGGVRVLALAIWAIGAVAVTVAGILEWWCRRRVSRCLEELGPAAIVEKRCDPR